MKKTLIIILYLTTIFFISGCSVDIKSNKEIREEQEVSTIISWLQQRVESLNKEVWVAKQKLNWLQLQKQISDLQAENAKLKKTTTKKSTTKKSTTTTITTTNNTRAIEQAMKRAINEQTKCRNYKAAHPEAYLMSCD